MRSLTAVLMLCIALVGCSRNFTEHELDEHSFGTDTMATIQKESGLSFPNGCKGLKYHYKPPIDPIVFAKVQVPDAAAKLMEQRISGLTNSPANFPNNFANERCQWWPTNLQNVLISKKAFNGYFVEAYLVKENGVVVLYLKYFTI
jgi:hypothetical protein